MYYWENRQDNFVETNSKLNLLIVLLFIIYLLLTFSFANRKYRMNAIAYHRYTVFQDKNIGIIAFCVYWRSGWEKFINKKVSFWIAGLHSSRLVLRSNVKLVPEPGHAGIEGNKTPGDLAKVRSSDLAHQVCRHQGILWSGD